MQREDSRSQKQRQEQHPFRLNKTTRSDMANLKEDTDMGTFDVCALEDVENNDASKSTISNITTMPAPGLAPAIVLKQCEEIMANLKESSRATQRRWSGVDYKHRGRQTLELNAEVVIVRGRAVRRGKRARERPWISRA